MVNVPPSPYPKEKVRKHLTHVPQSVKEESHRLGTRVRASNEQVTLKGLKLTLQVIRLGAVESHTVDCVGSVTVLQPAPCVGIQRRDCKGTIHCFAF